MAAMVIVIMSIGMPAQPIIPSTRAADSAFGMVAKTAKTIERNRTTNITKIARYTAPIVLAV